jgi:hypothetical protein
VHVIKPDGSLGEPVADMTVTRGGVVRELEVGLIMSADAAENIGKWMIENAQKLRDRIKK